MPCRLLHFTRNLETIWVFHISVREINASWWSWKETIDIFKSFKKPNSVKNSRAKNCIYWTTLKVHRKRKVLSNKSLLFGNATIWKHSEKERISNEKGSMMNKWFYTMHVSMGCLMQLTFNGRIYTTNLQNHLLFKI